MVSRCHCFFVYRWIVVSFHLRLPEDIISEPVDTLSPRSLLHGGFAEYRTIEVLSPLTLVTLTSSASTYRQHRFVTSLRRADIQRCTLPLLVLPELFLLLFCRRRPKSYQCAGLQQKICLTIRLPVDGNLRLCQVISDCSANFVAIW